MNRPNAHIGLRHLALYVQNFTECLHFYSELLGMTIDWQPDPDNIYLTSGYDNVALHRATAPLSDTGQHMDHMGFILAAEADVDVWHDYLKTAGVTIKQGPKTHRDGTRSFYCTDPDGNLVQLIWIPTIAEKTINK